MSFLMFFHKKPFLKAFIEFVTILLLFYVLFLVFFGHGVCGILASRPGIRHTPPALEVLTTGLPGNSQLCLERLSLPLEHKLPEGIRILHIIFFFPTRDP